jgi:hypothetical protein
MEFLKANDRFVVDKALDELAILVCRFRRITNSSTTPVITSRSISRNKETLLVSGLASVSLLIISWPAFKYFFFGEVFGFLQIYNLHGGHLWQAAFSPINDIFFRPGFFLTGIWWHFVLPPDPMMYHIRNFSFCCLNIFLLYQVLLRFVESRPARVIALCIFAVSKIHMTIIGRISVFEDAILLMTILLTVLFWFRYIETRRWLDYVLTLASCIFAVYSKDHGLVVIGVLAAMIVAIAIKPGELITQRRYWAIRFAPFVIIAVSYLVVRYILIGPIDPNQEMYSPRLSFSVAAWQAKAFAATVGNFSLTRRQTMGAEGFSAVFGANSKVAEYTLCVSLWLLIVFTLWRARSSWRLLIVPVVWIGLYLSPIFLIRNHNIWNHQEPLVGVALLIGICLERAKRPLLITWSIVIALIATNGYISNRRSDYDWQDAANKAETIVKSVVASQKRNPTKAIVFVTTPKALGYWNIVMGGPMIPNCSDLLI